MSRGAQIHTFSSSTLSAFYTQAHLLSFSFSFSLTLETHKAGERPQVCDDNRHRQTRPALQPFSMSHQPLSRRISSCLPRSILHFLSQRLSNDTGDNSDAPHIHLVSALVFNSLVHLLKMHHKLWAFQTRRLDIYHIVDFILQWYCYIANMDTFEKVWRCKRELDSVWFCERTQKVTQVLNSLLFCDFSHLNWQIHTTKADKLSVLASIHIKTLGYVLWM